MNDEPCRPDIRVDPSLHGYLSPQPEQQQLLAPER